MVIDQGLDYDDVLILPITGDVNSREEVNLTQYFRKNLSLDIPIIGSPMKGIMHAELALKLYQHGSIGILHRFQPPGSLQAEMLYLNQNHAEFGVAIGFGDFERSNIALDAGAKILCVDVANGYTDDLARYCYNLAGYINKQKYDCLLMAGNVVTKEGAKALNDFGVDMIRVGIGSGNLCTTRNVTGIGCPQLTAIDNCKTTDIFEQWYVVADGGIRNSGDIVKAIAFGADVVMVGSLLAQTFESANNGIIYGMASRKLQEEYYQSVKSIEGIEKIVNKTQSVEGLLQELSYGIRSACTYVDAKSLAELRHNAEFIKVGNGSIKNFS